MTRRGHDDVEQEVGTGSVDEILDVAGDDGALEPELGHAALRARRVEIRDADDAQIGDFRRRLEPGPAHRAAPYEGRSELHRRSSWRRPLRGTCLP